MLTKAKGFELDQKIEIQRGRIRRMEYQTMGLLSRIILDADAGSNCPEIERVTIGRRIEFMNTEFPIAISEDQVELLLPYGLPKLLPDIPDPRWPGASVVGEKTPYIKQRWEDRASARTKAAGREYLVFRPINTIEVRNLGYFRGCCWPKIRCMADFDGEQMALLLDPATGAGHLVGGRFVADTRVRVDRQAMQPAFST